MIARMHPLVFNVVVLAAFVGGGAFLYAALALYVMGPARGVTRRGGCGGTQGRRRAAKLVAEQAGCRG